MSEIPACSSKRSSMRCTLARSAVNRSGKELAIGQHQRAFGRQQLEAAHQLGIRCHQPVPDFAVRELHGRPNTTTLPTVAAPPAMGQLRPQPGCGPFFGRMRGGLGPRAGLRGGLPASSATYPMASPTVALFDIDGTLIVTGGTGRRSVNRAFFKIYGRADACDSFGFDGMTDRLIARMGLEAIGVEPTAEGDRRLARRVLGRTRRRGVAGRWRKLSLVARHAGGDRCGAGGRDGGGVGHGQRARRRAHQARTRGRASSFPLWRVWLRCRGAAGGDSPGCGARRAATGGAASELSRGW